MLLLMICTSLALSGASPRHLIATGASLAQSSTFNAQLEKAFPRPNWLARYASGSVWLRPDQWLKIAFGSQSDVSRLNGQPISVPTEQLVRIEFNAKIEKESDLMEGPRSGCSYARQMMPDR